MVEILHMVDGAKNARGIAVIIDVFRAFSFEAYVFHNNVSAILPVASVEECLGFRTKGSDFILAGEVKGRMVEGFDYGNSPTEIENIDFTGKTMVHRTSAGTQGLVNAIHADEVLTGSLVNAEAIAKYILGKKSKAR